MTHKHRSANSPSNHVPTISSSAFLQHSPTIANIQSHLNLLCSQHDSLMPLLSLLQTMPQISKTNSTIKQSLKRIQDLESALQTQRQLKHTRELKEQQQDSTSHIKSLFSALKQCKQSIRELEEKFSGELLNSSNIEQQLLPEDIEQTLTSHKHSIQYLLSTVKNNIQLKYKNNHFNIVLHKHYQRLIPNCLFQSYLDEIKNLYREVEIINMDMHAKGDLVEFHNFSCQRIKYELYEMTEIMGVLMEGARYQNLDIVARRVEMLYYQIKGLRKKYLLELNRRAKEGKAILQILEQFKVDLKDLEKSWNQTSVVLCKLRQGANRKEASPLKRMKAQSQI